MPTETRGYLRWVLGIEGAPKADLAGLQPSFIASAAVAAFSVALEVAFGESLTPDQARDFISRVRGTWVKPEALNPVLAERVLLSGYEDDDMLDDVPVTEIVRLHNVLAAAVLRDRNLHGTDLEGFLDEVEELMNDSIQAGN